MNKIIVIVGPTGVGKTKLSIALAKHFQGEVINADSMQVFKGLNIGTAKVTESEKENIKHHLLDIKEVSGSYSVYNFQKDGRELLDNSDKTMIIVGGTGLYIKSLLYNYEFPTLEKEYDFSEFSNQEIKEKILSFDKSIDVHINNRHRLERTLLLLLNNSYQKKISNELLYDAILIGLTTDRKHLYQSINDRVDQMIKNGLIEEVKTFYDQGIRSKPLLTGIGYKELYAYFDKKITLEEAIILIKKNSRHYAKRQYTWFNNQMNIKWFASDFDCFEKTINSVINYIEEGTN